MRLIYLCLELYVTPFPAKSSSTSPLMPAQFITALFTFSSSFEVNLMFKILASIYISSDFFDFVSVLTTPGSIDLRPPFSRYDKSSFPGF